MLILGISAFFHDAAARAYTGWENPGAATGKSGLPGSRMTLGFPLNAVRSCLDMAGVSPEELDAVVFLWQAFAEAGKDTGILSCAGSTGFAFFSYSMPRMDEAKDDAEKSHPGRAGPTAGLDKKKTRLLFCEHHLSHAASAFYVSPFQEAAVLTIDVELNIL